MKDFSGDESAKTKSQKNEPNNCDIFDVQTLIRASDLKSDDK